MFKHAAVLVAILAASPAIAQTIPSQPPDPTAPGGTSATPAPATGENSANGAQTPAAAASVPDGLAWRNDRLTLTAANGDFTISPTVRLDFDGISFFDQNHAGGYKSGDNLRRGRLGVRGTFLHDFEYTVTWEFGSRPNRSNTIYEAQIGWNFAKWGTLRIGAFTPQHLPEYAGSSFDLPFMERAAITNIAASLASGDTREAAGLEARGDRWNTSFYVTRGVDSTLQTGQQRGLVGRALYVALNDNPGMQFQIGFDGAAQFTPGTSPGPASLRLRDFPELRGGSLTRFLDTGSIRTDTAYAIGPEAAGRIGPVYLEALYQHVGVDVTGGGTRSFEGWYVEGAVPLLGPPRERNRNTGTWGRPKTQGWFNPLDGNWGAIEAAARYSTAELSNAQTRGGRQSIWTAGLNWYLSPNLRVQTEYENGLVDELATRNRRFQAFAVRVSLNL